MNFDLDRRRAQLSVGDLSDFSLGPKPASSGAGGLWRAQLGTRWHGELREQVLSEGAAADEADDAGCGFGDEDDEAADG